MLLAAALVLQLAAAPAEAEHMPVAVIDLYPHSMSGALLAGAVTDALVLHVPVSVTWTVGPSTAVHSQLSLTFVDAKWGWTGVTLSASMGPLFSFGPTALQGFFLAPMFTFQLTSARTQLGTAKCAGPVERGAQWSPAFLTGLQFGYQWTWGTRHIAVMLGGSFGYAYDNHGPFVDAFGYQRGANACPNVPPEGDEGFAFSVNTDLFRIGFAF